ncbi:MAG TPA: hypothetical protein VJ739_13315, partial [Gemmataceae bacterium]|nr:hypothetical protein [Gemmataceae bacterium]
VLILGISAFQYVASQMERRETEQQAERVVVKPATEREITEEEGQAALRRFEDAKRRAEQARRRV